MAIQATESGKSNLSAMRDAGKKNLVNMFFAELLFGLLSLVGIIFIVPGAMNIDISKMLTSENTGSLCITCRWIFIMGLIFDYLEHFVGCFQICPCRG